MKINISMSEKESAMWMGFLDRMVKQLAIGDPFEDEDDDEDSDSGEEYPAPIDFEEKKSESPQLKQVVYDGKLTAHQLLGRKIMKEMLEMWMINFDKEGVEQPDRGIFLEELSRDGKRAGAVVSFAMAKGCLSIAVHELLCELNGANHDPVLSRKVAANITQISSIHLSPLADQFKYPNPLPQQEATS